MNKLFSKEMFAYTEKVGMLLPEDTMRIIKHRYLVACSFSKGKKVLEVGVGQGFGIEFIGKSAKKYIGLEYSKENIDALKSSNKNYSLIHGDAHNMPFKNEEFEVIIALAMIYYLNLLEFLEEVKRVLVPNGKLVFCTSNKDVPGFIPSPYTTRYYSIIELKEILQKNGFECKFYGSFAKYDRFENLTKVKAWIKNLSKKIIVFLPFGRSIWIALREKHIGDRSYLPSSLDNIELLGSWQENFKELPDNQVNSKYRIVYCVANLVDL